MSVKNSIAMQLEGSLTESGNLLLDDFLKQFKALEDALTAIDREVNGRAVLDYRIIDLTHSSPATMRIEPVLKEQYRKTKNARYILAATYVHNRLFEDLATIRFKGLKPDNTREETFDALQGLIDGLGTRFSAGAIFNSAASVPLDVQLSDVFEKLSTPSFTSVGSVSGNLLTLTFARGSKFYIYPPIGPTSIACHFADDLEKLAKASIRKNVRVHGQKYFRHNTGHPFRIDVDSIEELRLPRTFVQLAQRKKPYTGEPADEEIARDRNEW
jgi:hypothetical protein